MQTRTLIAAVACGLGLSLATTVSADAQDTRLGLGPEQAIEASKGQYDSAATEAGVYAILGGGPTTGWQTLPPMTLGGRKSPTYWQLVQVRVGMGEAGAPWKGFSLELWTFPTPEVSGQPLG
jgi:hypothetical protein